MSVSLRCPECGNEEHPTTAIFCVKCGYLPKPHVLKQSSGPTFPGLFDLQCWLTGEKRRKRLFGPIRRAFALRFTVMPAPKQAIAVDGVLRLKIKGIFNKADVEREVRVRNDDFAVTRFDLLTISFQSLSYTYRDPEPEIPVPTDGGCKVELTLTTDSGDVYQAERQSFFIDSEPGVGPPPGGPWRKE